MQMKNFFWIGLMVSSSCLGQIPDYFDNNPTWRCSIWNSNQWTPPFISEWEHFVYYLNGDTILGAHTYHQVYRRGYRDIDFNTTTHDEYFDEPVDLYIRQDGRAIYYYNTDLSTDTLLVDYEMNVGEVFTTFDGYGCDFSNDTIQMVDSVLVNSEYRRVFYLDTAMNGPVITEGIGHQVYTNFDQGHALFPWCIALGADFVITCYGENLVTYWASESSGQSCDLDVSVSKYDEQSLVFENPVNNFIQLNINLEIHHQILILDLNGRIVLESASSFIDVSDLSNGTYLLILQENDMNKSRSKVVIQH